MRKSALFLALLTTQPLVAAALDLPRSAPSSPMVSRASAGNPIEAGVYTNRAGQQVHKPAHTDNGAAPTGASAQCRDGTWSFSMSRRGTCSHHGGVASWL